MSGLITLSAETPATPRRAEMEALLLTKAAEQINAWGPGGINLDEVARHAGISRNAVYHYVADKAELAYLCFGQTCDAILADLDVASARYSEPADQLRDFIDLNLVERSGDLAVLTDFQLFSIAQRSDLLRREAEVCDQLTRVIKRGIAKGDFRTLEPRTVARCLLGMTNWVKIAPGWLAEPSDAANHQRMANAIADLLLVGIATGLPGPQTLWPSACLVSPVSSNPFNKEALKEQKRQQILITASRMFNVRGIEGTSINDIVKALGATKGTFYHYFSEKVELVVACYVRAFEIFERFVEIARSTPGSGLERALMVNHLNCQAQLGSSPPLMLQTGFEMLPAQARRDSVQRARKIWQSVQELYELGIEDGSCRTADVAAMTEAAAGSFAFLGRDETKHAGKIRETADTINSIVGYGILLRA